jgi:hypothetical protein
MGYICSTYGEMKNTHTILIQERVGQVPLGSFRSRWRDNIKMDLKDISG